MFAETLGKIVESAHGNIRHPKCGRTKRRPSQRSHTSVLDLRKQCRHGAVGVCEGAHAVASLRVLAAHECDGSPCAHVSEDEVTRSKPRRRTVGESNQLE